MIAINAAGIAAFAYYLILEPTVVSWLMAITTYFFFACLGVTVTFHRHLAHCSFQFRWPWLRHIGILLGTLSANGSAVAWVALHRAHHKHSDGDSDVHGPPIGWRHFLANYDHSVRYSYVKDLLSDPHLARLHKHTGTLIATYYVLLFALGGLWAVAVFGVIPQMMTNLTSTVGNWFSHCVGYRNYETPDNSRNTWWLALPTWGDAWHNNHHAFPGRYSLWHKWWEIDISGAIIWLVKQRET
jgi:fatty-acid desaturase